MQQTIAGRCGTFCSESYGVGHAALTRSCACQYWEAFILGPMLAHTVHFLVQCVCIYFYNDYNPQGKMLYILYYGSWMDIYTKLVLDIPQSTFALIEMLTTIYVWMGIAMFPKIQCSAALPLSDYYYPIFMTIVEFSRLNLFAATQTYIYKTKYVESNTNTNTNNSSVLMNMLSVDYLLYYLMISFIQASVLWCRLWWQCCLQLVKICISV
mgnify:CR=1 FL=1